MQERISFCPDCFPEPHQFAETYLPRFTFTGVSTPGAIQFTKPVLSRGVMYVGGSDGRLYAANAYDGEILWWAMAGGPIRHTPRVFQRTEDLGELGKLVTGEGVSFVSDDGCLYLVSGGTEGGVPYSMTKQKLGGEPLCTEGLVRDENGFIWLHTGSTSQLIDSTGRVDSGFVGPRGAIVFNKGSYVTVDGKTFVDGGPVNPALVRGSGGAYLDGFEKFVVGFRTGWFALVQPPYGDWYWVPLWCSTASNSPVGGVVFPASTPDAPPYIGSRSLLISSSHDAQMRSMVVNEQTGKTETETQCMEPAPAGGWTFGASVEKEVFACVSGDFHHAYPVPQYVGTSSTEGVFENKLFYHKHSQWSPYEDTQWIPSRMTISAFLPPSSARRDLCFLGSARGRTMALPRTPERKRHLAGPTIRRIG